MRLINIVKERQKPKNIKQKTKKKTLKRSQKPEK